MLAVSCLSNFELLSSYNLRTELEQHLSNMFLDLRCTSIYNSKLKACVEACGFIPTIIYPYML